MKRENLMLLPNGRKVKISENLVGSLKFSSCYSIVNKRKLVNLFLPAYDGPPDFRKGEAILTDMLPIMRSIAEKMGVALCPKCYQSRPKHDNYCGACGQYLR